MTLNKEEIRKIRPLVENMCAYEKGYGIVNNITLHGVTENDKDIREQKRKVHKEIAVLMDLLWHKYHESERDLIDYMLKNQSD